MTANAVLQIGLYLLVLMLLARVLGDYMANVYSNKPMWFNRVLAPMETWLYKLSGVDPEQDMPWQQYTAALLCFNLIGGLLLLGLQLLQVYLPLNPQHWSNVSFDLAFNTAVSFVSNTNWQSYSGETTLSYLTQMLGLGVQNFVSAATGMAVLIALVRGFHRVQSPAIGNFWLDVTRGTLYILLPLSIVFALLLIGQGVVQTFKPYPVVSMLEQVHTSADRDAATQTIAVGPAASQIAIKQLGTNGGGFFNVNSAHPLENPTPLANFMEMLALLLIPAALCHTFGNMIGDQRQGWVILMVMTLVFVLMLLVATRAELAGNPKLVALGVDQSISTSQSGGNMEGKETRFGITDSTLWATATTAAANGSVNSMHDSYTPIGGMVTLWLIQLGEVIFGGVGSGLYGMLVFVLLGVFVAGLMIGRTPEYLGKKIEAFEMQMVSIIILIPAFLILGGTAIAVVLEVGKVAVANPRAHGFSEILYAFSSAAGNNGSAFAGLNANTPFYNYTLGVCMLLGRYGIIVPVLAIAGSLAAKKTVPVTSGTLATHTPIFAILLIAIVLLVGALTYVPALALGPVIEQIMMSKGVAL